MHRTGIAVLLKSCLTGDPGCNADIQNSSASVGMNNHDAKLTLAVGRAISDLSI